MEGKMKNFGARAAMTLLTLLCCLTGARANEVTVGNPDNATDLANFPINSQFQFSYTQQIFTADEIGESGFISSITLWLYRINEIPEIGFDIYMKEVDKAEFNGDYDWGELSKSDDKVYSGSVTVNNTTAEAYTFKLDKPFEYKGTGNLLIAFNKTTNGYSNDDGLMGNVFSVDSKIRAITSYRDNIGVFNPEEPTFKVSVKQSKRNVVKFDISPTIPVTVGDVSTTQSSSVLPMVSNYNYSYTQQIFTAEELGIAGTINSFTLWMMGNSSITDMPFDIYMAETDKASFDNTKDWVPLNSADIVYSGTLTVHNSEFQAFTFNLTTPFIYSGEGNLLIAFYNKTGKEINGLRAKAVPAIDEIKRSIRTYRSSACNPINPTFSANDISHWRNVVSFGFKPGNVADNPATLTVSDITYNSAKLTWSGGTGKYNAEYKPKDATEWERVDKVNGTLWDLINLTENTVYQARVQSVDADGNVSGWKTAQFTTAYQYPAPTDVTCTALTANTATISWKENGTATKWYIAVDSSDPYPGQEADTNPFTLHNLQEGVPYTIIIRAFDDNDGSKVNWSEPFTFEPTSKHAIGFGNATSSRVPTDTYYKYSMTKQLYTKEELGDAASIMSIDFYNTSAECTRNLDIYMARTSGNSPNVKPNVEHLVFSGDVTFLQNAWTTITLDSPFEYDGESNVVIIVDDNTGTASSESYFRVFTPARSEESTGGSDSTPPSQADYFNSNYTDYDPTSYSYGIKGGSSWDPKNQIRLVKEELPAVLKPIDLTAYEVAPTTATIVWTGNAQSYNVRWSTDGTEWTTPVNNSGSQLPINDWDGTINYPCFQLTGLEPETTYFVQVQACDPQKGESAWAMMKFTTIPLSTPPNGLHTSDMTPTSATLSWTGYQDSYQVRFIAPEHPIKEAFTQVGSDAHVTEELQQYSFDLSGYSGLGTVAIRYNKCEHDTYLYVDDITLANAQGNEFWTADFEDGQLPEGWKALEAYGADSQPWVVYSYSTSPRYHGKGYACSHRYSSDSSDYWLIIPNVTLGGTLTLYASCSLGSWIVGVEKPTTSAELGVYVSTDDMVTVPEEVKTISNYPNTSYTFENLKKNLVYKADVRGIYSGGLTEWSYQCWISIPDYFIGDVNGDFRITPADAIMILYHYFGVDQNGFIEDAADTNRDNNISPADAIEALYAYFLYGGYPILGSSGSGLPSKSRATRPIQEEDEAPGNVLKPSDGLEPE